MDVTEFIKSNGIKGAIFDMDGTLTDSMGKWNEIYSILFDCLGVEFKEEFVMRVNHIPMKTRVKVIIDEYSLNSDPDKVYEYWVKKAREYYKSVFKIKPYMLEALKSLNSAGVKTGVATASNKTFAEAFIESNNLTQYISSVTGLDEVNRPKSFPDIYLKAADKLGVKPSECIVFEDALTAIKAAKSGGFKVCGVHDKCSASDEENIKAVCDFTL